MIPLTKQERLFLCCFCAVLVVGTALDYAFKRSRRFRESVCVLDRREESIVDLNLAAADELTRLPNVGEVLAQRIIAFREERGGLRRAEELLEVKGIGPVYFEQIRSKVRVGGEAR